MRVSTGYRSCVEIYEALHHMNEQYNFYLLITFSRCYRNQTKSNFPVKDSNKRNSHHVVVNCAVIH